MYKCWGSCSGVSKLEAKCCEVFLAVQKWIFLDCFQDSCSVNNWAAIDVAMLQVLDWVEKTASLRSRSVAHRYPFKAFKAFWNTTLFVSFDHGCELWQIHFEKLPSASFWPLSDYQNWFLVCSLSWAFHPDALVLSWAFENREKNIPVDKNVISRHWPLTASFTQLVLKKYHPPPLNIYPSTVPFKFDFKGLLQYKRMACSPDGHVR